MGRLFLLKLEGEMYTCKYCHSHLALSQPDNIMSKSFQSQNGKAYLFNKVVNVTVGEKEDRMMVTGLHTVMDICCVGCGSLLGWKYELAHENSQKYKEGKFVLERAKLLGPDGSGYPAAVQEIEMGGNDPEDEVP